MLFRSFRGGQIEISLPHVANGRDLHVLFFGRRHNLVEQRLSTIARADHADIDARVGAAVLCSRDPDARFERGYGGGSGFEKLSAV